MNDHEALSVVARALSHPARTRILQLLAQQPECRGSELFSEIALAQSTVSEHLRVLRSAGLIRSHAIGTERVYCVDGRPLRLLSDFLDTIKTDAPDCAPTGDKDSNE